MDLELLVLPAQSGLSDSSLKFARVPDAAPADAGIEDLLTALWGL